jgi:hypothetical protein
MVPRKWREIPEADVSCCCIFKTYEERRKGVRSEEKDGKGKNGVRRHEKSESKKEVDVSCIRYSY